MGAYILFCNMWNYALKLNSGMHFNIYNGAFIPYTNVSALLGILNMGFLLLSLSCAGLIHLYIRFVRPVATVPSILAATGLVSSPL